ncbi:hypothetical protein HS088_TW22G00967 [Tripterygium wilfordii]|uniref:U2A'/phosphoprotein 32 family A C-terminal domain-containing protein n=1 Tax=Tripterygium wilfordii TaxID=458696 RepID=A0A7J7C085_TRIWF|nr:uncharacterized protein LOC119991261 [Tripterygium wilfordii]KAF5727277.1 hypothetical protein HS088_TW22G00967 [Tripterygium wilfordii]
MGTSIRTLEKTYISSCKKHGVLPNAAILSGFFKVEVKKSKHELCSMDIFLEDLKDIDFLPLLDVCFEIDTSEIEAVDVRNGLSCVLNGEYALSLMRALRQKLRVVDLQDLPLGKDFLWDLCHRGLKCQVLNMRSSPFRKLNMGGKFMGMHTLILDFSRLLTSFQEDCFTCMPHLMFLSMCETRVTNLWTTIAALSKLPSLVELRFQNWLCCTSQCSPTSSGKTLDSQMHVSSPNTAISFSYSSIGIGELTYHNSTAEESLGSVFPPNISDIEDEVQSSSEDSSNDSEADFLSHQQEDNCEDTLSNTSPIWDGHVHMHNEVFGILSSRNEEQAYDGHSTSHVADVAFQYISFHASPICFVKHYRDYMIASLPNLKVLDNLSIRNTDRERATDIYSQYFECLPYRRKCKESVVSVLHKREIKASHSFMGCPNHESAYPYGDSPHSYTRSLCAAKLGSSVFLHPLSISNQSKSFRPRQFEYHPSDSCLMVFGTLNGEVVVVNHENGNIIGVINSLGAMNSVLGLCWLKRYPSKLISGADNGSIKLYDIQLVSSPSIGTSSGASSVSFDDFDQLTSVHVNSTDELFLASGYSKDVALYDINSGSRLQVFSNMHREHINVVKFANHTPSIFATSSFDHDVKLWDLRQKPIQPCYTTSSSKGNVTVCFSPDDQFLLVSAVDNEVRQLLAVDGRLHLDFDIASTGSSSNYTRSYYMNGRDYIISGSCDEHVVRICCAQTGRRLRDISLEGSGWGNSMYVQSLRGDPYRDFNMSILAAYMRPASKSEIVKVNLLASSDHENEYSDHGHSRPSHSRGG